MSTLRGAHMCIGGPIGVSPMHTGTKGPGKKQDEGCVHRGAHVCTCAKLKGVVKVQFWPVLTENISHMCG